MYDLSDVTFIRRIAIGSTNPEAMPTEADCQQALDLLNRCLNDTPKGKIVGVEKSFALLNIGEHQVVLQALIYHVGFVRRPAWLSDERP
jgi:hypothetical protein